MDFIEGSFVKVRKVKFYKKELIFSKAASEILVISNAHYAFIYVFKYIPHQ